MMYSEGHTGVNRIIKQKKDNKPKKIGVPLGGEGGTPLGDDRGYDPEHRMMNECTYNQNQGYVVFSAMGSFFIPLVVMVYVYTKISCVIAQRHNHLEALSQNTTKVKPFFRATSRDSTKITHQRCDSSVTESEVPNSNRVTTRRFGHKRSTEPLNKIRFLKISSLPGESWALLTENVTDFSSDLTLAKNNKIRSDSDHQNHDFERSDRESSESEDNSHKQNK
ncbi:unnamed protein product [Bemisia tabaci]|uniref:Uncharacterized protein n=1 Tax=Bemisia tabaci TaxID=7038 RepID=A0A9P0AM26_BEMTA|nr:unnamed protein product [Bemisia tabaci]